MNDDLISRKALKEHKFVGNKYVQFGGRTNGKTLENINKAYQQGWNDCIDAIIDNAPAVEEVSVIEFKEPLPLVKAQKIVKALSKRPQGKWIKTQEGRWIYPICSECGYKQNVVTNYCANCGAKMDKEDK